VGLKDIHFFMIKIKICRTVFLLLSVFYYLQANAHNTMKEKDEPYFVENYENLFHYSDIEPYCQHQVVTQLPPREVIEITEDNIEQYIEEYSTHLGHLELEPYCQKQILVSRIFESLKRKVFKIKGNSYLPKEPRYEKTRRLPKIKPTFYYLADQKNFPCMKNRGERKVTVVTNEGAQREFRISQNFYSEIRMQGSGVVYDSHGERFIIGLNGTDKKKNRPQFKEQGKCKYSYGASGKCLVPYHTIAADLSAYKVGDLLFVPSIRDITLPNGGKHSGYLSVQDTGGAFRNKGLKRIDLFIGTDGYRDNTFINESLINSNGIEDAFLVLDENTKKEAEIEFELQLEAFEEQSI